MLTSWNYLIITASNEAQAAGYRAQLELRAKLGLLADVQNTLVVADPDGKRIGSGGSTLCCLMEVLSRELGGCVAGSGPKTGAGQSILTMDKVYRVLIQRCLAAETVEFYSFSVSLMSV